VKKEQWKIGNRIVGNLTKDEALALAWEKREEARRVDTSDYNHVEDMKKASKYEKEYFPNKQGK